MMGDLVLKRYTTLSSVLKEEFGDKIIKLCLDGGFTCPNRDGKISTGGCLFCSEKGSGDFAGIREKTVTEQMKDQIALLKRKWASNRYIAYFQSFSNTYGNIDMLKEKYNEAVSCEGVVGLSVATRPDCINEDIVQLLESYNNRFYVWVELGLQSIKKESQELLRLGYNLDTFKNATRLLKAGKIKFVVHVIAGIPGETKDDFLKTVKFLAGIRPWGIKIHLMHVLKDAPLYYYYVDKEFPLLSMEDYVEWVCDAIELLPKQTVIHRLTGDGARQNLIAPLWSRHKLKVLSEIDRELLIRDSYQGKYFNGE